MSAPERAVVLKSWSTRDDVAVIKEVSTKGEYVDLCMAYLARKRHIPIEESRKFFHHTVDQYVIRLLNDKLVFKAENVLCNVSRDWKSFYYQYAFDTKLQINKELVIDHLRKKFISEFTKNIVTTAADDNENKNILMTTVEGNFKKEYQNYEFYWKLLKDIQKSTTSELSLFSLPSSSTSTSITKLYDEIQSELNFMYNLEGLFEKSDEYKKMLCVRVYFVMNEQEILQKLDKYSVWKYLVINKLYNELIKWCYSSEKIIQSQKTYENNGYERQINNLNDYYKLWKIDDEMFEFAVDTFKPIKRNNIEKQEIKEDNIKENENDEEKLPNSSSLTSSTSKLSSISIDILQKNQQDIEINDVPEILCNFFAKNGYFLLNERKNIRKILQRIFTTESIQRNYNLITKKLSYEQFLLDNEFFNILIDRNFTTNELLNRLNMLKINNYKNDIRKQKIIDLIIELKNEFCDFDTLPIYSNMIDYEEKRFKSISDSIEKYLQFSIDSNSNDINKDQFPIIRITNYLLYEENFKKIINDINYYEPIKSLDYVNSLASRLYFDSQSNQILQNQEQLQNKYNLRSNNFKNNDVYEHIKNLKHFDLHDIDKELIGNNELVSFTNQNLCRKYSQQFKLTYLHYLWQSRGSYACYYFFIKQLQNYSQLTKSQLHSTAECVTELAIKNFQNNDLIINCIAFIEMIGFDTQNLRSLIQLLKISQPISLIEENSSKSNVLDYHELIENTEKIIFQKYFDSLSLPATIIKTEQQISSNDDDNDDGTKKLTTSKIMHSEFPLRHYHALMKCSQILLNKCCPTYYLRKLCQENNWWKYLIIVQYFDLPLQKVKLTLQNFQQKSLSDHLLRALMYELNSSNHEKSTSNKRRSSFSRQKSKVKCDTVTHASGDIITASSISSSSEQTTTNIISKPSTQAKFLQEDIDLDIFAIILLCSNNLIEEKIPSYQKFLEIIHDNSLNSTSINLLKSAIKYNRPVLAILAAVVSDLNVKYCWIVWVAVSTIGIKVVIRTSKDYDELFWNLIETSVRMGCIEILHNSFQIFYKESKFNHLTSFLQKTGYLNFDENVINDLRSYLLAWSNDDLHVPVQEYDKDKILAFTIKLLLIHLKYNFNSSYYQETFLNMICKSGISDISFNIFDFCQFRKIFQIISTPSKNVSNEQIENDINYDYDYCIHNFDIELLIHETMEASKENFQNCNRNYIQNQYENLLSSLQESKQYDKAIELLNILNIPISDVIYSKWLNSIDKSWPDKFNFTEYEYETKIYSLSPEILINFYLHVASLYEEPHKQKYLMMKKALDAIKSNHLFPNECFDRDSIEYEMIICYLKNDDQQLDTRDIYYSDYFEQILRNERCVLYKSFLELKELANIDELNVMISTKYQLNENMKIKLTNLLNHLLDEGDIVQALRLQAMFEYRTLDLHFIVFCMALAEGLESLYNLSPDERHLLTVVEMQSFAKFNKRTLGRSKPLQQQQQQQQNNQNEIDNFDFEEIPSREKQDNLEAIQGLASRLKHGINIGKRIVMVYRAAMYLDKDYLDVLRMKDAIFLLKSAVEDDCLQKLVVVSDILTSTQMSQNEIAEFLSFEIVTAIIKPRFFTYRATTFDQSTNSINLHLPIKNNLWGYDLDKEFHLFLELCPNTTFLGYMILDYCDALRIYRKYQDNKNFDKDIEANPKLLHIFDNLKQIIQICCGNGDTSTNNSNKNQNHHYHQQHQQHHHSNHYHRRQGSHYNNYSKYLNHLSHRSNQQQQQQQYHFHYNDFDHNTHNENIINYPVTTITTDTNNLNEILSNTRQQISNIGTSNIFGGSLLTTATSQVLSHKKQNIIYVELLIKAYECFVHECSMEGIANVLNRSKLLNMILCQAKSWTLIVRMLIGIGRYREMYFCFDTLIKNEQFESLLGQFENNSSDEKINNLKNAIIWYLREYCPENKEYLKLAALHFLMFKELAELWEQEANSLIAKILSKNQLNEEITVATTTITSTNDTNVNLSIRSNNNNNNNNANNNSNQTATIFRALGTGGPVGQVTTTLTTVTLTKLPCKEEIINQLNEILNNLIHATENYLLDNKLLLAQKSSSNAELIALQIDLMNKAMLSVQTTIPGALTKDTTCICVLNVRSQDEFRELINKELNVPQAMILNQAYSYKMNWPEAILNQYIILERDSYLIEFTERMTLTDSIIENIVKSFQLLSKITPKMEENMENLIKLIESVNLKYKFASLLGFKKILTSLINEETSYYLKDINYGRSNIELFDN